MTRRYLARNLRYGSELKPEELTTGINALGIKCLETYKSTFMFGSQSEIIKISYLKFFDTKDIPRLINYEEIRTKKVLLESKSILILASIPLEFPSFKYREAVNRGE